MKKCQKNAETRWKLFRERVGEGRGGKKEGKANRVLEIFQ